MPEKVPHIRLKWAGGVHRFEIKHRIEELSELSPGAADNRLHDRVKAILERLVMGGWGADDVARPIQCGLIGGGDFPSLKGGMNALDPWRDVKDVVQGHVLDRPLSESVGLAQMILVATVIGVDPEIADKGLDARKLDISEAAGVVIGDAA